MRRRLLKLRTNIDPVLRALKKAERRARDLRPAFKAIRKPFRSEQLHHFKEQEGPDGKWPARKESTESRALHRARKAAAKKGRKRRPRKPPKPLGRLRKFRTRVRRRDITAESPIKWSGIHQRGGKAGHGARNPARPFLWVQRSWLRRYATPALRRHIFRLWGRG